MNISYIKSIRPKIILLILKINEWYNIKVIQTYAFTANSLVEEIKYFSEDVKRY